jgi:hypothetical protein
MAAINQAKQIPKVIDSNTKIGNYETVVEEMRTLIQIRRNQQLFN